MSCYNHVIIILILFLYLRRNLPWQFSGFDDLWVPSHHKDVMLRTDLWFVPCGLSGKRWAEGRVHAFHWDVGSACLFWFCRLWANTHGPPQFLLTKTARPQSNQHSFLKEMEMHWSQFPFFLPQSKSLHLPWPEHEAGYKPISVESLRNSDSCCLLQDSLCNHPGLLCCSRVPEAALSRSAPSYLF